MSTATTRRSIPLELRRHILALRCSLCFQLGMLCWKKEWQKKINAVNAEYSHKWAWWGGHLDYTFSYYDEVMDCVTGTGELFQCEIRNYRNLENPRDDYDMSGREFFYKMPIYDKNCVSTANFPGMWYYYTIRPDTDPSEWFVRFMSGKPRHKNKYCHDKSDMTNEWIRQGRAIWDI